MSGLMGSHEVLTLEHWSQLAFAVCTLQIINLSEKRHDLSKMNPKVRLEMHNVSIASSISNQLRVKCLHSCAFRPWIQAGRTCTLHLWIRSAPSVRPWRAGSMLTLFTWWSYTAGWASLGGPLAAYFNFKIIKPHAWLFFHHTHLNSFLSELGSFSKCVK